MRDNFTIEMQKNDEIQENRLKQMALEQSNEKDTFLNLLNCGKIKF